MTLIFVSNIGLPDDAQKTIISIYEKMHDNCDFIALGDAICNCDDFSLLENGIDACTEKYALNKYELRLTLFVTSIDFMKKQYEKRH